MTIDLIKNLREKTGLSISECKKAITESKGSLDEAIKILKERGSLSVAKKLDREVKCGIVSLASNKDSYVIIKIACETDFVARNENFLKCANQISNIALESESTSLESLQSSIDIKKSIESAIQSLGENISIIQLLKHPIQDKIAHYTHNSSKDFPNTGSAISVIDYAAPEDINTKNCSQIARQICMHIVATKPSYLNINDIPSEIMESNEAIYRQQLTNEGKKPEIISKIVQGKMSKFCEETVLLKQKFVMDDAMTIEELLQFKSPEGSIKINKFSLVNASIE